MLSDLIYRTVCQFDYHWSTADEDIDVIYLILFIWYFMIGLLIHGYFFNIVFCFSLVGKLLFELFWYHSG